jgi:hypothetical protein
MRRSIPILALLAMGTACASAATRTPGPAAPAAPPPPQAVLTLDDYLGVLLTVPVQVGDTVLPFLFDTGGGGSLFTPDAAARAGCDPFGRVTGFRHNGETVHAARCAPSALVMDGWTSPEAETGVYDLMELLPDGVPTLGGLVGLSTFDGTAITLDLGGRRVIVETPASLRDRVASMTEVPYREGRQSGGAMLDPFLSFETPDGPVWFEMDSGNAGPVLIAPHAAAQLGYDLSPDEPRPVTLRLRGFGPVEVMAQEREMIYDGLLNGDFMEAHLVTLDLAAKRAWVMPSP